MMELLTGDVMISALADLLLWVIVFVVVYLICRAQRLKKDIIMNAQKETKKMIKSNKNMVDVINKGVADRNRVRKEFWKFKHTVKNTKSIVQVFLYEKGDDSDLNTVVSLLSKNLIDSLTNQLVGCSLSGSVQGLTSQELQLAPLSIVSAVGPRCSLKKLR